MVGARLVDAHVFGAGAGVMESRARADARVSGVQASGARAGGARAGFMENKTRGRFCGTKPFGCAS